MTQLVICGPTRFHAIDEQATAALAIPRVRELAAVWQEADWTVVLQRGTKRDRDAAWHRREESADEFQQIATEHGLHEFAAARRWALRVISRHDWEPGYAIPQCGMVNAGVAVPIHVAEARGLSWSQECARRNGIVDSIGGANPLLVTRIVTATGRSRAFRHAVDCEVCWNEGIAHCEIFPLIARGEIDSDVDPRLEELLA